MTTSCYKVTLGLALVVVALVLLACTPTEPSETDTESSEAETVSVDRITYVNSAGNVFTIGADGADRQRLTGGTQVESGPGGPFMAQGLEYNIVHAWPTWSPDGTKLAVSRVRSTGRQDIEVTIQLLEAVTGRSRTVYDSDFPGLVADGSPHYLYWSPDSKNLSFLASTRDGLTLFVTDTQEESSHLVIERGAPLYYSWSGDGNSLLLHIGEEVKLFSELSDHAVGEVLATARGFRVPAFSPDGQWLAYVDQTDTGSALFVAQIDDLGAPQRLADVGGFSAFMWSPTGDELAVADQVSANSAAFERLRLVSAGSGETSTVTEEPMLAFYWSPDARRLAWVGLEREQRTFEWKVAEISPGAIGESRSLFSFHPSREVLTMLTFFDQYAYSHSPWSPDSSQLVVAGSQQIPFERRNGHTPTGSRVFVLDVDSDTPAREISEGTLAFWSWN